MRAIGTWRLSYAAALVALALLSLAGVRSNVMQVQMSAQAEISACGMSHMQMGAARKRAPATPNKTCSYCAVAAHAPICGAVSPVILATAVAWVSWPPVNSLGARGPPERDARARGPPRPLFIA